MRLKWGQKLDNSNTKQQQIKHQVIVVPFFGVLLDEILSI
jgi:hypothetical protein